MRSFIQKTLVLTFTTSILVGCAAGNKQDSIQQQAPAFLPNYSLLKEVRSPASGTKMYVYKNPAVKRSDYHAAIFDSVSLYQTANKNNVTDAQIEKARANINAGIQQILSKKLSLTQQPGPGVLRLNVAITGARVEADGFKPRNLIPISAVIKLASMATGTESKHPVLVVELKMTDSQTNTLLKEVVTVINGEKLSDQNNLSDSFAKLATTWVQEALKYSN